VVVDNRVVRASLVALEACMGLAAVVSGPALVATDGLGMPASWMENSPFGSYTLPGLVLLAVGMGNLAPTMLLDLEGWSR
jgi:hypothetical protein